MTSPKKNRPVESDTQPRRSWGKRLLFISIVLVFLFVAIEGALRVIRTAGRDKIASVQTHNGCDKIVFWCIGDSMTYGLGAERDESYPAKIPH